MNLGTNFSIRFNAAVYGDQGIGKDTFVKTVMQKYLDSTQTQELLRMSPVADKKDKNALRNDYHFTIKCPTNEVVISIYKPTNDTDVMNKKKYIDALCSFMHQKHLDWIETNANMLAEQDRLLNDNRIHCLFYFLSPQNIKEKDFDAIAALSKYTCVVPIISKSDTLTGAERKAYLLQAYNKFEEIKNKSGTSICYDFHETNIIESAPIVDSSGAAKSPIDVKTDVANAVKSPVDAKSEISKKCVPKQRNIVTPNEKDSDKNALSAMDESFYLLQPEISTEFTFGSSQRVANEMVMSTQNDPVTIPNVFQAKHVPGTLQNKLVQPPLNKAAVDANKKIFRLPNIFAIVCDSSLERNYSWGCVKVCDDATSDFCRLQKLVFETQHIKQMRDEVQKQTSLIYEKKQFNSKIARFRFCLALVMNGIALLLIVVAFIPQTQKLKLQSNPIKTKVEYHMYDAMETAYDNEDEVCDDSHGFKAWLRNVF